MQPAAVRRRKWRGRLLAVAVIAALLLALPLVAQFVVPPLAAVLAGAWGLTGFVVEIDRPGWRAVTVPRIAFASGRVAVRAEGGRIEYRLGELVRGRARSVVFDRLALTVHPSAPGAADSDGAFVLPVGSLPRWRAALPLERAEVRALEVAVPAVGFAGHGRLLLGADVLELSVTGQAPAAAAGFQFDLRADPEGAAVLRVSERTPMEPAAKPSSAPILAIEVTPAEGGLDLAGDVRLQGYAWNLAAGLLDLPSGAGALVGRVRARLPAADAGGFDLTALRGEGRIRSLQWTASSGAPGVAIDDGLLRFEGKAVSGELAGVVRAADIAVPLATRVRVRDLAAQPLTVTGEIRRGALEGLAWSAGFDPLTAAPRLELEGELPVAAPFMKSLLARWRGPWDLDSGSLGLKASLRWPESPGAEATGRGGAAESQVRSGPASEFPLPHGTVTLDVVDASAHYEDYRAAGLAGRMALDLDGAGWRLAPTALRAATLSAGFEITDLNVGVAGGPDALALRDVTAQAFGGTLAVAPFEYNVAGGSAAFSLQLSGIDLARLLALYGERMAATGVLDGTLPVTVAGGAITVRDGTVAARPPGGVIRLAPELTRATGQSGLDFALAALANFTYTRLTADVDYAPSGDLTLGVALQGRNPEVEGGRPIHYNLNVSDNVLQLLESLTLHERLVRDIEQRVTD